MKSSRFSYPSTHWNISSFLFTGISTFFFCTPCTAVEIYALGNGMRPIADEVLNSPHIQGISIRPHWQSINPQQGVFDWSFIDSEISRAAAAGKSVQLRLQSGAVSPDWLTGLGAQTESFFRARDNIFVESYVPWDSVYLSEWQSMVTAFGGRYANNPNVSRVHMTGPTVFGAEMFIPDEFRALPDWNNGASLVASWMQVIQTYSLAFPGMPLSLNASSTIPHSSPSPPDYTLTTQVADSFVASLGPLASIQYNGLDGMPNTNPNTSHTLVLGYGAQGTTIGFQSVSPALEGRFDGTIHDAIEIAKQSGAAYFEVYEADIPLLAPEPGSLLLVVVAGVGYLPVGYRIRPPQV